MVLTVPLLSKVSTSLRIEVCKIFKSDFDNEIVISVSVLFFVLFQVVCKSFRLSAFHEDRLIDQLIFVCVFWVFFCICDEFLMGAICFPPCMSSSEDVR